MVVEPGQRGLYRQAFSGAGQAGTQKRVLFPLVRHSSSPLYQSFVRSHRQSSFFPEKEHSNSPERPLTHLLHSTFYCSSIKAKLTIDPSTDDDDNTSNSNYEYFRQNTTSISTTDTSLLQLAQ